MVNGNKKGKAGERELAKYLNALFEKHGADLEARRGQQYNGLEGRDVVCSLTGLHIECKRVEKLNLQAAVAQSEEDAEEGEVPVVCHRRNLCPWLLTVPLSELVKLSYAVVNFIEEN